MKASHFNLIDEKWVPVGGQGLVSLKDIFSHSEFAELGGNPIQKIAMLKFLLAIAQAACTPEDDQHWHAMTPQTLGKSCLAYLETWRDAFWLYGEKPFLQMPAIVKAEIITESALLPHISTGNTTILFDAQQETSLLSAERAMLLLTSTAFGLGGKKTDNKVVLSPSYMFKSNEKGKPATGKPGACLGFLGYLHHFLLGRSILETVLFNLLTQKDLHELPMFSKGVGKPPWEKMPEGEACAVARDLKQSLMGRLLPLSKFVLLGDNGVHYTDGIMHANHLEGGIDPSVAYKSSAKKVSVLWANPEKQPWRDLTAVLSFVIEQQDFTVLQLTKAIPRVQRSDDAQWGIWSGGLKVSSNAGEQYVSGTDDFVESSIVLRSQILESAAFSGLKAEVEALETLARSTYASVLGYYKEQKHDGADYAKAATNIFWQLCETRFQDLLTRCACYEGKTLRTVFAAFVRQSYDLMCPKDTAKQLANWAKHQPQMGKYLSQ